MAVTGHVVVVAGHVLVVVVVGHVAVVVARTSLCRKQCWSVAQCLQY